MIHIYNVGITTQVIQNANQAVCNSIGGSYRGIQIVTDTIQSALAIARTKLHPGEIISSVNLQSDDVHVDLHACEEDAKS